MWMVLYKRYKGTSGDLQNHARKSINLYRNVRVRTDTKINTVVCVWGGANFFFKL